MTETPPGVPSNETEDKQTSILFRLNPGHIKTMTSRGFDMGKYIMPGTEDYINVSSLLEDTLFQTNTEYQSAFASAIEMQLGNSPANDRLSLLREEPTDTAILTKFMESLDSLQRQVDALNEMLRHSTTVTLGFFDFESGIERIDSPSHTYREQITYILHPFFTEKDGQYIPSSMEDILKTPEGK